MLIALAGVARCGKDTICKAMGWQRIALADALKGDLTPVIAHINAEWQRIRRVTGDAPKEILRPIMVEYGRAMRKIVSTYWLDRLVIPEGDVCLTDCRYTNEVTFVMAQGGIVIRVERPGVEPANVEEAESFRRIDKDWPHLPLVINNGTPEEAAARVLAIVKGQT